MLYVEGRKSFEMRREKENYDFAVCQKKTHGKLYILLCAKKNKHTANCILCRVPRENTRQSLCRVPTHSKA